MASFDIYNILDEQQHPEGSLSTQQTTSSSSQDLMTDYRTNNSFLFLSDSPPSYPVPSAPVASSLSPSTVSIKSTSVITGSYAENSLYSNLRQMIATECQQTSLPSSLFHFSSRQQDVTSREATILARLKRAEQTTGTRLKDLSRLFRHNSASIEIERVQMLSVDNTPYYMTWLNSHFDQQRHQVMDRVERSLQLLEHRAEAEKQERDLAAGVRRRRPLSRRAIQLMESWYCNHQEHPYPSATVVEALSRSGNVTSEQIRKWFANKRNRNCNTRSLTEIAKKKHQTKFGIRAVHVALQHDLI